MPSFKIIESLCQGKIGNPEANEDALLVTENFIAVLDGVSTVNCPQINDKSGGRFAVDTSIGMIRQFSPLITAREAVDALSANLLQSVRNRVLLPPDIRPPSFGMAIYSAARKEVWRVCDCAVMQDGVLNLNELPPDKVTSEARAFIIEALLLKGATIEGLRQKDVSRETIKPLLQEQHHFSNREGAFGYGVIDGRHVPDCYIEIFDASKTREIVLATDGYPFVMPSLEESEGKLAALLVEDPLLFRKYKSTKGHQAENLSFDDRTYVRFLTG